MERIYKYELRITDAQAIEMPEGARVLTAQMQHGRLCVWAIVNPDPYTVPRRRVFYIAGTGHDHCFDGLRYIATVQDGVLVWHVFEPETES